MSRLTFKKDSGGYGKVARFDDFDAIMDKLGRYENIGEPVELVKVVRCKDCTEYDEDEDGKTGLCEIWGRTVYPNAYCSRESRRGTQP